MGKIPILRDGDVVVPDSSVICAYLEKRHPSPALYPADPADFAKALFLEEYADTRMFEVLQPGALRARGEALRVPADARRGARRGAPPPQKLPPVLDYLESQLPEAHGTVLARFCIADAAVGAQLGHPHAPRTSRSTLPRWPRTASYYGALLARPSFKTAMAR